MSVTTYYHISVSLYLLCLLIPIHSLNIRNLLQVCLCQEGFYLNTTTEVVPDRPPGIRRCCERKSINITLEL